MGTWGAGIFEDDVALDVRDAMDDRLAAGLGLPEATEQTLADFAEELADSDDRPVIWLALAAIQLENGSLAASVRRHALEVIDRGDGLERWQDAGEQALSQRRHIVGELKTALEQAPVAEEDTLT